MSDRSRTYRGSLANGSSGHWLTSRAIRLLALVALFLVGMGGCERLTSQDSQAFRYELESVRKEVFERSERRSDDVHVYRLDRSTGEVCRFNELGREWCLQ